MVVGSQRRWREPRRRLLVFSVRCIFMRWQLLPEGDEDEAYVRAKRVCVVRLWPRTVALLLAATRPHLAKLMSCVQ